MYPAGSRMLDDFDMHEFGYLHNVVGGHGISFPLGHGRNIILNAKVAICVKRQALFAFAYEGLSSFRIKDSISLVFADVLTIPGEKLPFDTGNSHYCTFLSDEVTL